MSLFDFLKPKPFKAGPLSSPTKFIFLCSCGGEVNMEIPKGMAKPSVLLKCSQCTKGEILGLI